MRRRVITVLLSSGLLALSACGGGKSQSSPTPLTLSSGNFLLLEDSVNSGGASGNYPTNVQLAGALTSGSSVSLTALPISLVATPCFPAQTPTPTALVFTGSTSGNNITMAYTGANQQMTITAAINPGDSITGTYVETGNSQGGSCIADNGTVYGTAIPSLTGTWTATLPGRDASVNTSPVATTAFSASFTQSSTASTTANALNLYPGSFPLSGSVTLNNPSCFSAGTVTLPIDASASYVQGPNVVLSAASADKTLSFTFSNSNNDFLQDPRTASSIVVEGFTMTGDLCVLYGSASVNTVFLQKS